MHHFTAFHLSASIPFLGEVDLQLVQQGFDVHLGQVGDQNAPRTDLRGYLQHRRAKDHSQNINTDQTEAAVKNSESVALLYLHQPGHHQLNRPGLHSDAAL